MTNAATLRFDANVLSQFLRKVYNGFDTTNEIEPGIWREVLRIINEGTVEGLSQAKTPPTHDRLFYQNLRHSNEVFAAFKVHQMGEDMAAKLFDANGNLKPFDKWVQDVSSISSHQVGSWLRTEYDTAVIRAHAAADWQEFERNKDIFPNLRWMPTTSPEPESTHAAYWRLKLTLPVDDPFWNEHHPGDRWNCKCSLEATDEPVNRPDGLEETKPQRGLENNPGKDGHIFNDTHPYFPKSCYSCPFNKGFKNMVGTFFNSKEKDCHGCSKVNAKLPTKENEYKRLLADPDYKNVQYDPKTGAIKAMHVGHNVHKNDKTKYFGNMTGDDLENECCSNIFRLGHTVIGRQEMTVKEVVNKMVLYKRELDIKMDGRLMDIASLTKNRDSYEYTLLHKNKQLFDFNNQHEDKGDTVLLYFHDPSFYTEAKIKRSIEKLKTLHKYAVDENGNVIIDENGKSVLSNELYDIYIKHVIVVTNDLQWKEFDV